MRISDQLTLMLPTIMQTIRPLVIQGRQDIERDFDALSPIASRSCALTALVIR
jgi:hypothetical protein